MRPESTPRVRRLLTCLALVVAAGCTSPGASRDAEVDRAKLAQVNTELGMQYLQRGDYETAMQKIDRALVADPDFVDAHNAMGLLHAALGENDKAERSFERALAIGPRNSAALNNYGQFLCRQGRHEAGQAQFLKAVGNPLYRLPAVAYSNAGTCAFDAGDLDTAEGHFRKALEIDPRLAPALLQMADLSYRLERYLPARGYLQRYLEVARHTPRSLWLGIRIERELEDRDAVASYSLQLERGFPDAPETRLLLETRTP